MGMIERLVYLRKNKILYPFVNGLLLLFNVEIPKSVQLGKNVRLQHRAMGTVIHPLTRIGNDVTIFHQVTIGAAIPWDDGLSISQDVGGKGYYINIQDNAILCAGCKILYKKEIIVGKGTVIAANAVLICSTGENEIWAGVPAKCVGKRKQ